MLLLQQGNDLALGFPKELPNAACGYGPITEKEFPGYKLVGISAKSSLKARPMGGCGTCLEVKCVEPAVSSHQYSSATYLSCLPCDNLGYWSGRRLWWL